MQVCLQFGSRYGVLCIDMWCERSMHVFTLSAHDVVGVKMLITHTRRAGRSAHAFPTRRWANFFSKKRQAGFDNAYVLRLLASADECVLNRTSAKRFHSNLRDEIVPRACVCRLRTVARRQKTRDRRLVALLALSAKFINEESLRLHIVRLAGIY